TEGFQPVLQQIKALVEPQVFDVNTPQGRADIASLAYKVARTQTYLDNIGKDLVAEYKELPKRIDASRKHIRDELDALKDSVRAPLDEWEAQEKERIAAIELVQKIMRSEVEAWELNELFDFKREKSRIEA